MHLRIEDSGHYTLRAINRWGEAISQSTMKVISTCSKQNCPFLRNLQLLLQLNFVSLGRSSVTGDLDIPEQQRHIDQVEALETYQKNQHRYKTEPEPPESISSPQFITPIKSQKNIPEGGFAHFDARLEPLNDSTLKVEWLKDGKLVEASKYLS